MRLTLWAFASVAAACIDPQDMIALYGNQTTNLDKRFYRISQPASRFWPGGTIKYCFDASVSSQNVMETHLQDAWKRWVAAGVDANFLTFEQGSTADCQASNRPNILLVTQNTAGKLSTSYGHSPAAGTNPGPSMNLDLSPTVAMADTDGNVAHEIGHAWGMLHEHQRPDLWSRGTWPDGTGESDWFAFNCQNLVDYQQMIANTPDPAQQRLKCREYAAAIQPDSQGNSFLAAEFVPLPDNPIVQFVSPGNAQKVDMESIMLYGSQAGGSGTSPNRAIVLTLANGNTFGYNNVPSRRDVNALNAMYGSAKYYPSTFYWARNSPYYSTYNRLRGNPC